MEASSILSASAPLQLKTNSPFSSSTKKPNPVSSHRFLLAKNNKTVTLRCLQSHTGRNAFTPPRYFTTKTDGDRCASALDKLLNESPLLDQCIRFYCFHNGRRKRFSICKSTPSALSDKSVFHLSKHGVNIVYEKCFRVPCAAVGPDEPHAASTAWPEGVLEQQSTDYLADTASSEWMELQAFLGAQLPSHPKLYSGQLENGLRYLIFPNKVPQNRFEADMEVHAGSIDEEDDEQWIAHMIEHVAFLGSKKREKLLRTGALSNAYTDFHHTVFHIHSPTSMQGLLDMGVNAGAGGNLDFLRNSQQFQAFRSMVQANSQILQPLLQELGRQNPQLVRLIQDHQADFLRLINEPAEGENVPGQVGQIGQMGSGLPSTVTVTVAEREAIGRLEAMGFERSLVLEVFLASNKNEEPAANYLLDHMHEFEE